MTRPTWDSLREWKPAPEPMVERLLTGPGLTRASDPETSKLAAERIDVGGHRALVLRAIASFTTPATRDMVAGKTGLTAYQASKRIPELAQAGLIEVVGTLPGYSGHVQQTYRVTVAGLRVLRRA